MPVQPLWTEGLTPEANIKAKKELGENGEIRERSLKQLKLFIQDAGDFEPLTEDTFLLRFLRAKKFDVRRAFKTLRNYYAYKAKYSGFTTDLTPRDVARVLVTEKVFFSPVTDPEGGLVIILYVGSFDINSFTAEQMVGTILSVAELALGLESVQVGGVSLIWECTGITIRQMLHYFRPTLLYMAFQSIMDTLPVRVKGLHAINEPYHFDFLYNTICRPLLSRKLRERAHLHGKDLEDLHRYLPPECLPENLGGRLGNSHDEAYEAEVARRQPEAERLCRYVYKGKAYPAPLHKMWKDKS